jgi:hypothetical protein
MQRFLEDINSRSNRCVEIKSEGNAFVEQGSAAYLDYNISADEVQE